MNLRCQTCSEKTLIVCKTKISYHDDPLEEKDQQHTFIIDKLQIVCHFHVYSGRTLHLSSTTQKITKCMTMDIQQHECHTL